MKNEGFTPLNILKHEIKALQLPTEMKGNNNTW